MQDQLNNTLFTEPFVLWLVEQLNIAEDDVAKVLKRAYIPWTLDDLVSKYKKTTRDSGAIIK